MLNKTCTIKRKVLAQSATTAAYVNTLSSIETSVPCTCQVDSGSEEFFAGKETAVTRYRFYFLGSQTLKTQDELSAVTGFTNVIFDVQSVGLDDSGRGMTPTYIKVIAIDRKGQNQA